MKREDCYPASLPAEFAPPDKAADAIVALHTRAEREAYWLLVPEKWRPAVGELTKVLLGQAISELPDLDARRAALLDVPEIWLEDVKWQTRRLFATRDLRAEYRAQQAADRAKAISAGKWK